jgi:long-subunit acyl-CoA synthetase (AMP-forming)
VTAPALDRILPALDAHPTSRVRAGHAEVTFAELRDRIAAAAGALAARGVGPGRRVGILGASSLEWLVADLAALALGAVSVPFDPGHAWTVDRLRQDWELEVLLADRASGPEGLSLASLTELAAAGPAPLRPYRYGPGEPFTVKLSSGTSARPKAVAARAAHFDHMARHIDAMFPLGPDDTFVVFGSLATWLQRFMAQLCLLRGARICLALPAHAAAVLERERPTLVLGVPRLLESLHAVSRRRAGGLAAAWGGRMRYLWTGSAPIDRALLDAYDRAAVPVYEGYGMTETGMIAKNHPGRRRIGSVGPPFPDKEVRIADDGEILVRSDFHAADRYLHGEAGVFRPGGWVATGDLGRLDEDGYLYVIGRTKDTLVLGSGHKVHPPAIEEALRREPAIADCAVFGHGQPHLVAVLVPADPEATPEASDQALRAALDRVNASAAAHQRVLGFVRAAPFADAGLTTPTGKLDRAAVAARFRAALEELYRRG